MTYIHQRSAWPGFTWQGGRLAPLLAGVRHQQGRHLGRLEALGFEWRTEASVEILTSEVVKTSAIEGEVLDSQEVRSSIARRLGLESAGVPTASREVEGIVEVMLDATQHYEAPLDERRLFAWHGALFPTGRSGLRSITVGAWRTASAGTMEGVSGAVRKGRIHYQAPGAGRLPREIERFLNWFNSGPELDPVLAAGIAHFWFVTIHPFEDGNGRIARAIGEMSLARAERTHQRFYSLSSQIEAERTAYYDQLESAQRGDLDITEWLAWFLGCLGRAVQSAESQLVTVLTKARFWQAAQRHPIHERQRRVLDRLLDGGFRGHLTTAKYAKLARCSTDTALRDINQLVATGLLVKNPSGGRSTSEPNAPNGN